MEDKYRIMTLKYLYSKLDLKKYEKILEDNNIESIMEDNDYFKYFTLLSDGDMSLFDKEEQKEMEFFDQYEIDELLSNEELENNFIELIKKTYQKFYFSDTKGEYLYYKVINDEHMAPDDAFALGLNYMVPLDSDNYDESVREANKVITSVINNIQFTEAKEKNLKIAVLEYNGLKMHDTVLTR